jgi:hypothetical protein
MKSFLLLDFIMNHLRLRILSFGDDEFTDMANLDDEILN